MYLCAAVFAYGLGFVCYTLALQRIRISLAYPVVTAITMFLVTATDYVAFAGTITPLKAAGIVTIVAGRVYALRFCCRLMAAGRLRHPLNATCCLVCPAWNVRESFRAFNPSSRIGKTASLHYPFLGSFDTVR